MRRIYILLLGMALAGSMELRAEKEVSYLPAIAISDQQVTKKGREVELTMAMDLSGAKVRTQHTVAITPVLVAADGSREQAFPPVVIDGKTRHKIYLRAQRLESVELPPYHGGEAQTILRYAGKEQRYDYAASVPYARWMLDGRVELREAVHGCVNCGAGNAEQPLADRVLPAYTPHYQVASVAPDPEPVKVRAETRTARLQFRQDSHLIQPGFKGNRAELDTVSNSIELVKQNADVKIIGIYITGYASPEGSEAHNLRLSERRAQALADYIRRHDEISAELLHVDWKGEDWEGFVRSLDDYPNLLKREEIYALIERYPEEHDYCEAQFRKLVPPAIYERLLNEIYPVLRRNEYRIEYNVRNFNLEEARQLVESRPDLLSLAEMYKVAGSYEKGSPAYEKVMATALRHFPESPAALNDNARCAMERGDYAEAIRLLERSEVTARSAELLTTLGVAYAEAADYERAMATLSKAAEMGSATARQNLEEVRRVVDQL